MTILKVTARRGVCIIGIGSREFGETFEIEEPLAQTLVERKIGLEPVKPVKVKAKKEEIE